MRAPWAFSKPAAPGERGSVPNVPTEDGAELGAAIARLCEREILEQEREQRTPPERCVDCAFRLGTTPNQCAPTLMDAVKCLVENTPFWCHHDVGPDGEPTRLCAGLVILRSTVHRVNR